MRCDIGMPLIKLLSEVAGSLHFFVAIAHLVVHDRRLCVVSQLAVEEISDDLAGSLLHVCDASGKKEASFAGDLCQEAFHVFELRDSVVLDQLVVFYPVEKSFDGP